MSWFCLTNTAKISLKAFKSFFSRTLVISLCTRATPVFCLLLGLLFIVLAFPASSKNPLVLKEESKPYLIDSSHFIRLDSIGPMHFQVAEPSEDKFFTNKETEKSHWYRFTIRNELPYSKDWLLVSYNYAIDEIDLWTEGEKGNHQVFRHSIGVYDRHYVHKQPVFEIPLLPFESKTFYLRIKNGHSFNHVFAVYSYTHFVAHFFMEYLLYGLFYGFMLFVIAYSSIHAAFLKDRVIALYALFITSQVLHMMFRDGTGLFLVPYHSEYVDVFKNLMRGFFGVFLFLYTASFLKIKKRTFLCKMMMGLAGARAIYTLFIFHDMSNTAYHIELFTILFCNVVALRFYQKGNEGAKAMAIGLSLLSSAYFVYYLSLFFFPSWSSIGFFGLYYGVAAESIFMTLALTNRFRKAQLDNFRKERMNKDLEHLVMKRTAIIREQHKVLEERSDELNLFLYSMSHDFKGPIKTIEGLCQMGTLDRQADHMRIYSLILQKLKNLESNINDLKQVSTLKNEPDANEKIDFATIHGEMLDRFREFPGFGEVDIHCNILLEETFKADAFSIRCIYQNLFENAIKFRDPNKASFLLITVKKLGGQLELVFQDNGEGIAASSIHHIFNMFYRASENAREDTGMGLYIVQLAVEKLGGRIHVESTLGQGSTFIVLVPF